MINPKQDKALVIFNGVVADVQAIDLPEGAAAVCTDMDFTIGSVRTRDGLESVYTYQGASETLAAGFGADVEIEDAAAWSNPDNISHNEIGTYATVNLNGAAVAFSTNNPNAGDAGNAGANTLSVPVAVIAPGIDVGDTGLVVMQWASPSGSPITVSSMLDTLGNAYSLIASVDYPGLDFSGHDWTLALFSAPMGTAVAATGSFTINVNFSGTCNSQAWFGNMKGVGALLGISAVTQWGGTVATNFSAGPITTSGACVLVSAATSGSSISSQPFGLLTQFIGDGGAQNVQAVAIAESAGTYSAPWAQGAGLGYAAIIAAFAAESTAAPEFSDILQASTFGFSIPSSSEIIGVEVTVNGKQSEPSTVLTIVPIGGGTPHTFSLEATDSSVSFDAGLTLTPAEANSPGFGFNITASDSSGGAAEVFISGVVVTISFTPEGVENFNFVQSFPMQNGTQLTLAIDNTGILWQENVDTDEGVLVPIYTAILPNSFANGQEYDDRAWLAMSDLSGATDIPLQYNGQWVDRVSQVGPGAAPSFSATSDEYSIVTITQPAPVTAGGTGVRAILLSTGPGNNSNAGNVITIYYGTAGTPAPATPADPNVIDGNSIYLKNFGSIGGVPIDGTYIVNATGVTFGHGGGAFTGYFNTFSVTAVQSGLADIFPVTGSQFYQAPLATLTTSAPIPNVQVGSQISLTGVSPASWDATWTILYTPNAASLVITSTSLTGNVATYDYTIQTGVAPTAGEQITVVGTNNGNGIFNVSQATILSAGPASLSVSISSPDITSAAEDGNATVNGTEFQFDPGLALVGTATSPIFGTGTGGSLVQPGNLGAGVRLGVCFFITRNGTYTACSVPVTFNLTEGAAGLVCTQLPIGPPNTVARGVAFTPANGAFYYFIPQPVQVENFGQKVTYTSTLVNDNVSTQATFTFTDDVLIESTEIDVSGNNLFEQIELGSSLGFIAYANRLFAIGEQNKIQNLINLSFDGGYLPNPAGSLQPLGWTVDNAFGANGALVVSPKFGNSYSIANATGSTIAGATGMIWQTAFQDYLKTPIITLNTQYGVRITAESVGTTDGGDLVIDLFSPSFSRVYGSLSVPLADMTSTMQIFIGNLLTAEFFSTVPSDLIYRLYATGLTDGANVIVDRSEPFDLSQPTLSTQMRASYAGNFEGFDDVTGNLGFAINNQQPVRAGFTLYENLYAVKTKSFYSTSDNDVTEPYQWKVREVSKEVGTDSINGVDYGENWCVIAGRPGVYVFDGGQAVAFNPEIAPIWDAVNWKYGYTLWVKNDITSRRLFIGVPMATPNQWAPRFPKNANPTVPNVVIMCQYKELMSSGALASEGPVRQGYQGQLKTFQLGRKWSLWSIESSYADLVTRDDGNEPLFYCGNTGTAKIYEQKVGNWLDDGEGFYDHYVTYPFLKSDDAQQMMAGLHQMLLKFATSNVKGSGLLTVTVFPDDLASADAERLDPPFDLFDPNPDGDTEMPANIEGDRFFLGFETEVPGDHFELSRITVNIRQHPHAPLRGSNHGS